VNDATTAGYGNQFAVYGNGKDYSGSGVYGIGYVDSYNMISPIVSFASAVTVNGFFVNNTTYVALDMREGSGFSKKFGGASGTDEDWFKLTIEGYDASNGSQGLVDFYLADYRFADNGQDYILADWTFVDLSSLNTNVSSLRFSLSSSDNGMFGMNTPAYFAIDNMQAVPEPASVLLFVLGLLVRLDWFSGIQRLHLPCFSRIYQPFIKIARRLSRSMMLITLYNRQIFG
jgi:hypothetical protein